MNIRNKLSLFSAVLSMSLAIGSTALADNLLGNSCDHCPSNPIRVTSSLAFDDAKKLFNDGTTPTIETLQGEWKLISTSPNWELPGMVVLEPFGFRSGYLEGGIEYTSLDEFGLMLAGPKSDVRRLYFGKTQPNAWTGAVNATVSLFMMKRDFPAQTDYEVSFHDGGACFARYGYKDDPAVLDLDGSMSYSCRLIGNNLDRMLCSATPHGNYQPTGLDDPSPYLEQVIAYVGYKRVVSE